MSTEWHYAIGDKEYGPVSPKELKRMATTGELKPTDQVWRAGMSDWVQAGSIKNLCPPRGSESQAPQAAKPAAADDPPHRADDAIHQARDLRKERKKRPPKRDEDPFELGDQATQLAREASQDALAAFQTMLRNPVGGLAEAYDQLGPTRALGVGIVFAVAFAASFFVSLVILNPPIVKGMVAVTSTGGFFAFVKIFLLSLLSPIGIIAGCAATRKMFNGEESYQSDVFIGGAALLPQAVIILLAGLLGTGDLNAQLVYALLIFAMSTTTLMLYSGSTRLHRIPEAAATIAVPIILLLCIWITRILATALRA